MKNKKAILSMIFFVGLGLTGIQAQQSIAVSGGNASGVGGSVSYTVGQIVYTTHSASAGAATPQAQQTEDILETTEVEILSDANLTYTVYPNPTSNFLTLKIDAYNKENLMYQLFDVTGKILESKKVSENQSVISLENLPSANYFLKVTDNNNQELKSFKIVKIN